MSALAAENNAVNLSQGFPDFPIDPSLADALRKAVDTHNQYAPMPGYPRLRALIADQVKTTYQRDVDPESELTLTAGATQAIYTAVMATVSNGDEVIIFTPAYDCYEPPVIHAGGVVRHCPLNPEDFSVNWDHFRSLLSPNTRLVILNTPHNPTGTTWSSSDMKTLEELVEQHNLYVISDEVYEYICFDPAGHQSANHYPALRERSFIISSFGKTFHITGWKTGYCVAPKPMTQAFRNVHQYLVFSVNSVAQRALELYMEQGERVSGLADYYRTKRDRMAQHLSNSRFTLLDCMGTYFMLLDYSEISDESDIDFAKRLTVEHKIATIPISVFSPKETTEKRVRLCFAKQDSTLDKAAEILCKI